MRNITQISLRGFGLNVFSAVDELGEVGINLQK